MSDSDRVGTLRGRRNECAPLDRLLADVRSGSSRVLVLRGEAGIGKTALIEYLVGNAADCQITRAAGVESQMELAFAGLHQLCAPFMDHLDRLPPPQREALSVAFGLSSGGVPDRFLVGLAVLSLLAEAAETQPLLCVVDDTQWLDRVSAQTLAFVARRVLAERVAFVFAERTPVADPERDPLTGLPELQLRGLPDKDARALLVSAIPGRVDSDVIDRIVAEARGNPLALLELPQGLTSAQLAGGYARPDLRPVVTQIEHSFLQRIEALSTAARRVLLTAAAEPLGDMALLRRAVERLDLGADAMAAAEKTGLIEFEAQVRFRHPLVRSAAYRAADPGDRRAAHRALAEETDPALDPDRRAWHRASATVEPDEQVAAELERSAVRARARGGVAAAAAFLRRATGLTPDPGRRGARAVSAAQFAFEAGSPEAALELLAAAEMGPLDAFQRARLARLRAQIVFARRRGGDALPLLLDAAHRMQVPSPEQARETYLEAIGSAVFAGRLNGPDGVRPVAELARAALPASGARAVDVLLNGLAARFADGYVVGAEPMRRALRAFRDGTADDDIMRWLWLTGPAAADLWDDEAWHELTAQAVRTAREAGALNFLPLALTYHAAVHVHAGEFDMASTLVQEAEALTAVTGNSPLGYTALLLDAWRGADPRASVAIAARLGQAADWGEGRAIGTGSYLLSVLHNGQGQYQAALDSAGKACEHDDLAAVGHALAELVEAGVRAEDRVQAQAALRRLERRAHASGTDWALGMLARSRALLSAGEDAERSYREALERLSRTRIAVYRARTHLVYGEWLRRENRRSDAREQLRTAYDMLHRFGADGFAERARRELLAAGESVRRRDAEASDVLSAQEVQIARLAGAGLTNSEIGAELFISPRTVEWHLRKVFAKLNLTSRKELRQALNK
ncbi:AAA family ATPase [Nocardia tengchongensis]|uniref:AAA family ATPase n=1 Tax=Nocardia tengchongensis TaxID=2055889 RepID=A0ABX8CYC2_9NOCA|nr:LuxR family transcriptional regulator [Nocardia tengchongensis]QVI24868.1 AAA family ATPase [Nocardia tengchongensis]